MIPRNNNNQNPNDNRLRRPREEQPIARRTRARIVERLRQGLIDVTQKNSELRITISELRRRYQEGQPAQRQPAQRQPAQRQSAQRQSAQRQSAQRQSVEGLRQQFRGAIRENWNLQINHLDLCRQYMLQRQDLFLQRGVFEPAAISQLLGTFRQKITDFATSTPIEFIEQAISIENPYITNPNEVVAHLDAVNQTHNGGEQTANRQARLLNIANAIKYGYEQNSIPITLQNFSSVIKMIRDAYVISFTFNKIRVATQLAQQLQNPPAPAA